MKIQEANYYHVDGIGEFFSIKILNKTLRDFRTKIEDNTKYELRFLAKYLKIPGRTKMTKEQLINEINKTEGKIQHTVIDSDSETDSDDDDSDDE